MANALYVRNPMMTLNTVPTSFPVTHLVERLRGKLHQEKALTYLRANGRILVRHK
jgi:hypothetical protein